MSRRLLRALLGERYRGGEQRQRQQQQASQHDTLLDGALRRDGSSRRSEHNRRAHRRRLAPIGAAAVRGVLLLEDGQRLCGSLWDLSEGGLCLAVQGHLSASCGACGQVLLYDPVGPESVSMAVEIRWLGSKSHDAFLGLCFSGGAQLPEGTFLDAYLDHHWSDLGRES
ncbi:PilZ domain-containing protein [Vulcanococcus limneticus Candia 3F8]|uniref:PilZ domain-containing protein n=1 Tax=Vulcanococcus limneticus TaxID=2170428 RepID=UPI000B9861E6|nr:PilZ domain-containing protein [Vulcanococcus limneticus]MCP9791366.1 PilZ domain-containing protein [Vulcanococcus limneticus MW73D5]MCP9893029.1 PilZ domain-containing protein [Vulcanococcus limneticus Candia 3F8]MCP9896833.1 PilZ domain-containing protein [Vulcanococcus limneticus Candia 3B3]